MTTQAHRFPSATPSPARPKTLRDLLGLPTVIVGWVVGLVLGTYTAYFLVLCYPPLLANDTEALRAVVVEHGTVLVTGILVGAVIMLLTASATFMVRHRDDY